MQRAVNLYVPKGHGIKKVKRKLKFYKLKYTLAYFAYLNKGTEFFNALLVTY